MRAVSAKKRKADAVYAKAREDVYLRSYGRCEANTPACPAREHQATQVHHILPRSQAPKATVHDVTNLLAVCDQAHDYIHAHPEASYMHGWLKRSWEA